MQKPLYITPPPESHNAFLIRGVAVDTASPNSGDLIYYNGTQFTYIQKSDILDGIEVKDHGTSEATNIQILDFEGLGITIDHSGTTATMTIPGLVVDHIANRPAASSCPSTVFFSDNTNYFSYSNGSSWSSLLVDLTNGITGTLALTHGGTGATDAPTARTNLGLGNLDNTSDVNKPVSTAQAAADALNLKISQNLADLNSASTARTNLGLGSAALKAADTDGTLAANSDSNVATQKSTKTYVDKTRGAYLAMSLGYDWK